MLGWRIEMQQRHEVEAVVAERQSDDDVDEQHTPK
jgi:hypothetical protein